MRIQRPKILRIYLLKEFHERFECRFLLHCSERVKSVAIVIDNNGALVMERANHVLRKHHRDRDKNCLKELSC
jgi:hypothetical protein